MSTNRILLVYAHRDPGASRVNRALLDAAASLSNVTVHNLTARYPDLRIDTEHEQRLLLEHDTIVLQFPFYWYSTPAILKEWQDAVLAYGFAYGENGDKLHGKKLMIATTTGGPAEAYEAGGYNQFTLSELLRPLQATANLAGMSYEPIFAVSGVRMLDEAALDRAATAYRARLVAF
ncbi:NAD(P)H-dependent oxidoreductase [Crenobacter sp. SG2303]|uniref:NAD(P)H-dependent oxidoreductase n=1 Tax=Crenobacter oryzisoli TaxID=3056844 RepID=A0ABT7XS43_9NEIS|nr:NAD(P)H-dependent oxidoreductase [Crenobacter sp. SG2303]MDN0076611.1 NAD(P)H-dependent oxidoreductase [Crenobacter sp. SG2303]